MSKSISKQISDRGDITKAVVASAERHGEEIVAPLERLLFPDGAPSKLTVEKLIDALGKTLTATTESMQQADVALFGESSDADRARAERDERMERVRSMLFDVRSVVSGVYGDTALKACGLIGETPAAGEELCNHAKNVVAQLRRDPFEGLEAKLDITAPKPDKLADALDIEVAGLDETLSLTKRETREYQLALEDRDAKVEQWSKVYRGVAEALSAFFVLGGRPELADRVRPTARRAAGKIDDAVLETTETATTSPGTTTTGINETPTA